MGGTVPYTSSFARCDANLLGAPWATISTSGMTPIRPIWEAAYAHYVNEKGLSMPYTKALVRDPLTNQFANGGWLTMVQIQAHTPDGQSPSTSIADGAAFQTLRFRLQNSGL